MMLYNVLKIFYVHHDSLVIFCINSQYQSVNAIQ